VSLTHLQLILSFLLEDPFRLLLQRILIAASESPEISLASFKEDVILTVPSLKIISTDVSRFFYFFILLKVF
jgi:hypothetical protein